MIKLKPEYHDLVYYIKVYNDSYLGEVGPIDPLQDHENIYKQISEEVFKLIFEKGEGLKDLGELDGQIKKISSEISPLKFAGEKGDYLLLKSDGFKVPHTGFYIYTGEMHVVSEIFYSYTLIKKEDGDEEKILPYLLIFKYNEDNKLIEKKISELYRVNAIDAGNLIVQLSKKAVSEVSLPTQMTLDVVKQLYNLDDLKIDVKELYSKIRGKIQYYIDFPDEIYLDIIALWSIGTYFSDVFRVYPILFIIGSSGSGKTRLTELITSLARRGFMITDPTDENLPRIIEGFRPTLGFDDFDIIMRSYRRLVLSLLKHTYKDSVRIPRLEKVHGDRFILGLFNPYAPSVVNSTEPLEETQLITRYIKIEMIRSRRRFPRRDPDVFYWEDERRKLYQIRFLYAPVIYDVFNRLETGLTARDDEIWGPILSIAKFIDGELYEKVRGYAVEVSRMKEEELYPQEKLVIKSVERMFNEPAALEAETTVVEFTAGELLDYIKYILLEDEKISEKQFEREWNYRKLGRVLERMHIPKKKTTGGKRIRRITREELENLRLRYSYIESGKSGKSGINIGVSKENSDENLGSFNRKERKSSSKNSSNTPRKTPLMPLMPLSEDKKSDLKKISNEQYKTIVKLREKLLGRPLNNTEKMYLTTLMYNEAENMIKELESEKRMMEK